MPVLLVVVQEAPGDRHRGEPGRERPTANIHSRTPARKNMRAAGQHQHHRGAEIGLLQHQRRRHQDHQRPARSGDSGWPTSSTAQAVEIARERQHERDLHQLRRLQLHDAEIDPALRAHADDAARSRPRPAAASATP